jgi:RimJ/RimL family protein N-acetyltransferase
MKIPLIRKARRVVGKTLILRDATLNDAQFIVSLRTDPKKSRHLSPTSPDIDAQRTWLERYSNDSSQAYFIIEQDDQALGTMRCYDQREDSVGIGSWILKDENPVQVGMESALMIYTYAFDHLGFAAAHYNARKDNRRVWRFHERFGARRVSETAMDFVYTISHETFEGSWRRYRRFLPNPVTVEYL